MSALQNSKANPDLFNLILQRIESFSLQQINLQQKAGKGYKRAFFNFHSGIDIIGTC